MHWGQGWGFVGLCTCVWVCTYASVYRFACMGMLLGVHVDTSMHTQCRCAQVYMFM